MSHIYPPKMDGDPMAEAAEEITTEWVDGRPWWYPPVITLLWVAVLTCLAIAPALVIACWTFF